MRTAVTIIIVILILSVLYIAGAEEGYKYILCNPKQTNHVAIRRSPRRGADETGRLDCGDRIYTDGRKLNGYLHILGMTEDGEGWVHLGYVVDDEPVIEKCMATVTANGRVKARRNINGKRIAWLDVCTDLTVYARSEEWAVTNRGYIQTKFLEVWYGD